MGYSGNLCRSNAVIWRLMVLEIGATLNLAVIAVRAQEEGRLFMKKNEENLIHKEMFFEVFA
jgi:hypothetical protein